MKLLIDSELSFVSENIVTIHKIEKILKKYSVWFESKYQIITIIPQKVSLDEISMNHLFYDALVYFDFETRVSLLGGLGCDFSFSITAIENDNI